MTYSRLLPVELFGSPLPSVDQDMTTLTRSYSPSVPSDEAADASVLERYALTGFVLLLALGAFLVAQGPIVGAFTKIATRLVF